MNTSPMESLQQEKCEGCGSPKTCYDSEGIPLCDECAKACELSVRRIRPRFQWHWRRAGGIYLGVRLQFPCNVIYDEDPVAFWKTWTVSVGLIAATLHLDVLTKRGHPFASGGKYVHRRFNRKDK